MTDPELDHPPYVLPSEEWTQMMTKKNLTEEEWCILIGIMDNLGRLQDMIDNRWMAEDEA